MLGRASPQQLHSGGIRVCEHPIFVVGAPRSGTTGFARALARHSELWASAETLFLSSLFKEQRLEQDYNRWKNRPDTTWLRAQDVEQEEFLAYAGLGFNALFTSRSNGLRWIDHTPHHVLIVDTLAAMFPGAFFLHILRDGRSAVDSMINMKNNYDPESEQQMRAGNFLPRWATDFRAACQTWKRSAEAGMRASKRYPRRCLTVSYERLANTTEMEFRRVFDFIRVAFEQKPIEFWQSKPVNSSFRTVDQERQRLPGEERWQRWTDEERATFADIAGPALEMSGAADAVPATHA